MAAGATETPPLDPKVRGREQNTGNGESHLKLQTVPGDTPLQQGHTP